MQRNPNLVMQHDEWKQDLSYDLVPRIDPSGLHKHRFTDIDASFISVACKLNKQGLLVTLNHNSKSQFYIVVIKKGRQFFSLRKHLQGQTTSPNFPNLECSVCYPLARCNFPYANVTNICPNQEGKFKINISQHYIQKNQYLLYEIK